MEPLPVMVERELVVLPTGYSFNLDGTTLYLSLASLFVAQLAGVHLSLGQQLVMMLTLMLTSKGVAGVPRAALVVLEQISKAGVPLSSLRKPFDRYAASGEINTTVDDAAAVIDRVAAAYPDAHQDRVDGLTVDLGDWWFNLRPSNTEPLLRLNLEAPDPTACAAHVAEVRALITQQG